MTTPITVREENPSLLIRPGDDSSGHCPTLLVDGISFHDPVQPYKEVLPLEGATPEVVVLFGVGLGYTAAGVLQLAPQARVLAWEPLPGMADLARLMLDQEWKLGDRVVVEQDPADFQARLMEAAAGASSLAVVELQALAAHEPGLLARFRDMLREVVAASTFGALPAETDGERWAQIARHASRLASLPRFASMAGTLPGSTAILVSGPPLKSQIPRIKEVSSGTLVLCVPSAVPGLLNAGIKPHLVLVHDRRPPGSEVQWGLSGSWLAVTPDSDPGWWDVPSAGVCLFGHSATAWLFPPNDMAHIISFRWGSEFPLAAAAAALGVSNAFRTGPLCVNGEPWNLLGAETRSELTGRLCLMGNGGELRPLPPSGSPLNLPPLPREQVHNRWKQAARPLGVPTLRNGVTRARLAVGRLIRERHRGQMPLLWEDLRGYLSRRVEGDAFTRSFVKPLLAAEPLTAETIDHRLEGTQGYLDWVEQGLPAAPPKTTTQDTARRTGNIHSLPLFIGGGPEDFVPQRVLLATLDSLAGTRVEVRFLLQEVQARFGTRVKALPVQLWPLLIPELCQNRGKALFIDPSVMPLEDPRTLLDLPLEGRVALVPPQGPPLLALIDCGRAPWSVDQVLSDPAAAAALLKPGGPGGAGSLPEIWSVRDSVRMDTAAVHFTCTPWLPWIQNLHPLRWLWEYYFASAVAQGYLTSPELEKSVEKGILRPELLESVRRHELAGTLDTGLGSDFCPVVAVP